jgi:predicted 5'-methylthioadenosine/S-adenosylhomocysteine nucleosidase
LRSWHEDDTHPGRLNYGPSVLLVAATPLELAPFEGVDRLVCGVGPVEAATATALRLASGSRPSGILHIGIAGARDLDPGTLVLGREAVYCDLGAGEIDLVRDTTPDPRLLDLARQALPEAVVAPIGTSAGVGGASNGADVEAMEGFAVLRAAELAGVPAIELRAVSNRYADSRDVWQIDTALDALTRAVPRLLEAFDA